MGAPEQRTANDPLAVETFNGPEKPAKRSWVEPNRTDHLFFVRLSANVKEITVSAIDPFGNVYSKVLSLNAQNYEVIKNNKIHAVIHTVE